MKDREKYTKSVREAAREGEEGGRKGGRGSRAAETDVRVTTSKPGCL